MIIWGEQSKESTIAALDKVNLKRLRLMLHDNRYTPKYVKLTRRSRRRMRGKGWVYHYPTILLDSYLKVLEQMRKKDAVR